jgi:hypothetical protein
MMVFGVPPGSADPQFERLELILTLLEALATAIVIPIACLSPYRFPI